MLENARIRFIYDRYGNVKEVLNHKGEKMARVVIDGRTRYINIEVKDEKNKHKH